MDNVNIIEYVCPQIPEYVIDVFLKGCCRGLAKAGIYKDSNINITWDSSCYIKAADYIKTRKNGSATEISCRSISAIRKIIESILDASDYLVSYIYLDLSLDRIYFSLNENRAVLIPGQTNDSFFDSIIKICDEIYSIVPESSADIVSGELQRKNNEGIMSACEILSFLSKWEMELKGHI